MPPTNAPVHDDLADPPTVHAELAPRDVAPQVPPLPVPGALPLPDAPAPRLGHRRDMAVDLDADGPRQSGRMHMPSARRAVAEGIPYIPAVERAVNEAKESAARIEQQRADAR